MTTLAALLGAATLSVIVPSSPGPTAAPPCLSLEDAATVGLATDGIDEWARMLLAKASRTSLYRDETVDSFLALSIPDTATGTVSRHDLEAALSVAQRQGHLTAHLGLHDVGGGLAGVGLARAGSSALPPLGDARPSGTAIVPDSTRDGADLTTNRWWLARVEARYVVLWHFRDRPRGPYRETDSGATFGASIRLSHDRPLGELPSDQPADDYMDEGVDYDCEIQVPGYGTRQRSDLAGSSSGRLDGVKSPLLPTSIILTAQAFLPVVSPLMVDTRVIPSPLKDGAILAVDVASAGEACEIVGLEVGVRAHHSRETSRSSQVEVRSYGTSAHDKSPRLPSTDRPLRLVGNRDRFAHLFSLRPSALTTDGPTQGMTSFARPDSLPIDVMTSPSQQFDARSGDESMQRRTAHQRQASVSPPRPQYLVTVTASVRMQASPTSVIRSEWYCDLDLALVARDVPRPVQPGKLVGDPTPLRRQPVATTGDLLPSPHAAAIALISSRTAPTRSRSAQDSAADTASQAYAGSYRFTRQGLTSSAAKSERAFLQAHDPLRRPSSTALTVTAPSFGRSYLAGSASPALPDTVATGPKRFFSLPHSASSVSAASSTVPHLPPLIRTETPPPMAETHRSSLPTSSLDGSGRPNNPHRKSWMSGLVSKSPAPIADNTPTLHGNAQTADPGPSIRSDNTDSLREPVGTSWDTQQRPMREAAKKLGVEGKVLVSVSLVPLRRAKSKRRPPASLERSGATTLGGPQSGDSALPSPTSPLPPHRATTFAFPSPGPSPPSLTQPLSPAPATAGALPTTDCAEEGAAPAVASDSNPNRIHHIPHVNALDIFLIDVFVLNQTSKTKHYLVRVPSRQGESRTGSLGVVPLETDIEIGCVPRSLFEDLALSTVLTRICGFWYSPLAPKSCAACALRFLALRPGSHVVDRIQLVDLADGLEMVLDKPVTVVVE
ncbi:hypothetical protein JCM3774_002063 [Rhodotorula dairenensis]